MSLFRSVDLIQRTHEPGQYIKGRWVNGAPKEDVPFKGTVQAASGKTMELLPEGKRSSEAIRVIAPINLSFTSAESEKQVIGDIIIWEGRQYEVQVVRPWKNGLLPHWELVATREKEGEK